MATSPLEPTQVTERISLIDSLRGMALLGILMMNMPYFANPYQVHFDLTWRNEFSGPNYWSWWVVNGLFEGTMRGTFSMLFGAGSLLLLERLQLREKGLLPADIFYRRLIWLILFGLFNAFILQWPGDILFTYGVSGLFIFPFRNFKPRSLVILGLVCLMVAAAFGLKRNLELVERKHKGLEAIALEEKGAKLSEKQIEAKESWQKYLDNRKPENRKKAIDKEVKGMQGNYFQVMRHLADINIKLESTELYKDTFWDAVGFFFLGMALFKWRVLTGNRSRLFYWIMAVVCLGLGLTLNFYLLRTYIQLGFDWATISEKFTVPPYQLKRLLMTLGNIGLFVSVYKLGFLDFIFRWLAKVGQMAFSNYLGQSIICTLIFNGYGFGYFGKLERYQTYEIVLAIWLFQIVFSNIWLHYFRFGPFEWVWRSLTYWKRQPFLKNKGGEVFVG